MLREHASSKDAKDEDRPNAAHLVRLPYPLSARSPSKQVTVNMKVAMQRQSARDMLENETETYNTFPRHLMEDWCGYNLPTPEHAFPVPATAVIPKFFGYYKPDFDFELEKDKASDKSDDEGYHGDWDIDWKTAVSLSIQRTLIWTQGVVQNSFFTRNIVMQPGPLTLPPEKRSIDRPSFRVIDFGRAELWADSYKAAVGNLILKDLKKDPKKSDKVEQEILRGESTEV
ncbi:hypothetical protein EVG20_g1149 [Dentipellis fragilis]|uniref:Uncharacterized protein n=1 Tax=Dentipellis fragilis TaxID=205917 RepID=A0A4Y9ZDA9_9AGAM|nr:hypothetical protein EVG20_g1149 [Dentipellis fragilis]